MSLSVVIADDEAAARARLRSFVADEADLQIVAECEDGRSTVAAIRARKPDLVFLDVRLPELNGLQTLDSVPRDSLPHFVFVTKDHELEAVSADMLDCLREPFDLTRFKATVSRVRQRMVEDSDREPVLETIRQLSQLQIDRQVPVQAVPDAMGRAAAPGATLDRITVKSEGRLMSVNTADVDFFESAANYVKLHVGSQSYSVREKISALADRLDPRRFARIHRTTIVNVDRIREVQPWFSGDAFVILHDGQKLRLSRMYRRALAL
jgi:two-component system LytT family response regulator